MRGCDRAVLFCDVLDEIKALQQARNKYRTYLISFVSLSGPRLESPRGGGIVQGGLSQCSSQHVVTGD